jgi:GH25 family lysozyme M1 (1,4-beta-N-acetylmuramidase)
MGSIKGIDISNNNSYIDFSSVATDGVQYVYLKATEGTTFKDSSMQPFYTKCKNNNLKVGAYHFLVGTSEPEDQARNFYSMIKDYEWDLIPMVDVETSFSGLSNYLERFIIEFRKLSPLTLGIYSYTSFINLIQDASDMIEGMPFWEANYNDDPWNLPSNFFTNRVGHQYTETGKISGVSERCDVNVFTEGVALKYITIPGQWIIKDNKWWYRHDDGSYTSNGWELINGKWYFFDEEGWMLYDWKQYGNSWYYFGDSNDGSMKSGWLLKDNKWYYLGSSDDGSMKTGWQYINNNWYYFDTDGAMVTGWFTVDGYDYLTYSTGELITSIDIYGYHFDDKGHATKL